MVVWWSVCVWVSKNFTFVPRTRDSTVADVVSRYIDASGKLFKST
jgi:hypothetical protein